MHWSLPNQPLQFQRELIETSHPRSEHSQGGAQRSEQYLYGHEDEFGTALATVDDRWGVLGARGNVAYLSDKWIAHPVDGHAHGIPIMDCADLRFRHELPDLFVLWRAGNTRAFSR